MIDLLENGNAISNSSVIVRKNTKKVGLIDESKELVAAEDYNTWLKIADLTNQFLYMPEILDTTLCIIKVFLRKIWHLQ